MRLNLGWAKKGLAGKPELGDTGDLFLLVVTLASERMPAAVVFETSYASAEQRDDPALRGKLT